MLYTPENTVVYANPFGSFFYLVTEPAKKPLAIKVENSLVMTHESISATLAVNLFFAHSEGREYVVDNEQIAELISRYGHQEMAHEPSQEHTRAFYLGDPDRAFETKERALDDIRLCAQDVTALKLTAGHLFNLSANGLLLEDDQDKLNQLHIRARNLAQDVADYTNYVQDQILALLPEENDSDSVNWG